eukprot:754984-Hanusia_phi.AAC.3
MVISDSSPSRSFEASEGAQRLGRGDSFSEVDKLRYRWLVRTVFIISLFVVWNEWSNSEWSTSKEIKRFQADYPTAMLTSFQSLNCSWSSGPDLSSRTAVDDMLFFVDSIFFEQLGLFYSLKGDTLRAAYQHRPAWSYTYTIYVAYPPGLSIRGLERQLGELVKKTSYEIFMTTDSRSIPGLYRKLSLPASCL